MLSRNSGGERSDNSNIRVGVYIGCCSGGSLSSSLYPLSSWSAPRLIPYVRHAVTFSVRRHLAACVRDAYSSAEAAPWLSPAQDALPPVPLLESSDALDAVVAAPPWGGRLSRLLLSQASCPVPLALPSAIQRGPVLFHVGVATAVVLVSVRLSAPPACANEMSVVPPVAAAVPVPHPTPD